MSHLLGANNIHFLKRQITSIQKGHGEIGTAGGNLKWCRHCGKRFGSSSELPYDSAILFLGNNPRELKTYIHPKTCTWMFIAELFIIAKE